MKSEGKLTDLYQTCGARSHQSFIRKDVHSKNRGENRKCRGTNELPDTVSAKVATMIFSSTGYGLETQKRSENARTWPVVWCREAYQKWGAYLFENNSIDGAIAQDYGYEDGWLYFSIHFVTISNLICSFLGCTINFSVELKACK
jgi:hypothetical protein